MIRNKNLPEWLRSLIYDEMGGSYEPDRNAFQNNLYSDEEKNRKYLGTYFPRSFTESYCIFYNLFDNPAYLETVKDRDSFSILSFGCGTGGDLMGLLEAIAEKLPWIKNIEVTAYDGNFNAIAMMKKIVDQPHLQSRFHIYPDYAPVPMENSEDFGLYCNAIDKSFDFIMSFKMVNELYRHHILPTKPYQNLLEALTPKLTGTGVMLLLDVPLKEKNGVNLPILLSFGMREFLRAHSEFEAMVPVPCHVKSRGCNERCYLRTVFYGDIFSSEKVTYCMLARTDMSKRVCNGIRNGKYVVNDDGECCKQTNGITERDVFNLKIK